MNKLADAGIAYKDRDGVFVYTSETVNSNRTGEYGRLFTLCLGGDESRTDELDIKCRQIIE